MPKLRYEFPESVKEMHKFVLEKIKNKELPEYTAKKAVLVSRFIMEFENLLGNTKLIGEFKKRFKKIGLPVPETLFDFLAEIREEKKGIVLSNIEYNKQELAEHLFKTEKYNTVFREAINGNALLLEKLFKEIINKLNENDKEVFLADIRPYLNILEKNISKKEKIKEINKVLGEDISDELIIILTRKYSNNEYWEFPRELKKYFPNNRPFLSLKKEGKTIQFHRNGTITEKTSDPYHVRIIVKEKERQDLIDEYLAKMKIN